MPLSVKQRRAGAAALPVSSLPALNWVHCSDSLRLLKSIPGNDIFDVTIADPPYNISKTFGDYQDNLPLPDYIEWSLEWINECLRLTKTAAPVYIYGYPEILAHIAVRQPLDNQRWLIWHYTNKTVPTSRFWQRSHEAILCLWKGRKPIINVDAIREDYTPTFINGAAGKVRKETHCRYSSKGRKTVYQAHPNSALPRDVIKISALAGGAGYAERWFYCKTCDYLCDPKDKLLHADHEVIRHPTQKPLALSQKLLKSAAAEGGYALIPFAGSGAECVAARQLGINMLAAEIDQDYALLANAWLKKTSPPLGANDHTQRISAV